MVTWMLSLTDFTIFLFSPFFFFFLKKRKGNGKALSTSSKVQTHSLDWWRPGPPGTVTAVVMSGGRRSVWLSKLFRPSTSWTPNPDSLFCVGTSSMPCQVRLRLPLWLSLPPTQDHTWAEKMISLKRHVYSAMAHFFSSWLLEYQWTSENAHSFIFRIWQG